MKVKILVLHHIIKPLDIDVLVLFWYVYQLDVTFYVIGLCFRHSGKKSGEHMWVVQEFGVFLSRTQQTQL